MFLPVLIFILLVAADRISKMAVAANMDLNTSFAVIDDFFYITYVENDGAAFSMLKGARWFFLILTVVVMIWIILYYIKLYKEKRGKIERAALVLVAAGAVGNFADRLLYGKVTDMLHFVFWGHSFAVFNVADICVVVGMALLAGMFIFFGNKEKAAEE